MSIDFIRPEVDELRPRISVIGVGGAGGNAIANMIRSDVQGVEFLVANTDAQALNASEADRRIKDAKGPRRFPPAPKDSGEKPAEHEPGEQWQSPSTSVDDRNAFEVRQWQCEAADVFEPG